MREIIFEFLVSGQYGRINAIDVATGTEVCVVVPANCSKQDREQLASRKLNKALGFDQVPQQNPSSSKRGTTA